MSLNKQGQKQENANIAGGLPVLGKQKALAPGARKTDVTPQAPVVPTNTNDHVQKSVNKSTENSLDAFMPGAQKAQSNYKNPNSVGNAGIAEMQKAIIALSGEVIGQIDVSKINSPQQSEAVGAAGRMSFNDFMVKNYLRNSPVQGVEFDPGSTKTKMEDKKPSNLKSMHVVMNTLQRIGQGKTEFKPDGVWGPRTNNAIKNVYAFANSLIELSKDFSLSSRSFTEKDLESFKELSPTTEQTDKDISILDKIKNAPQLAKLIRGVSRFYNEIKAGILEKPAYKSFIEGQAFEKYKKNDSVEGLGKDEENILNDIKQKGSQSPYASHPDAQFTVVMKGDNLDSKTDRPMGYSDVKSIINASDLVSKEAFETWQKSHPMKGMPVENILSQIKNQIEAKMKQRGPQNLPPSKYEVK